MNTEDASIAEYRQILLHWWHENGNSRDYPWRYHRTPYRTAVAELMLRRTRADQVAPVFERFLHAYPTLADAARADDASLERLLYPLGLAWRAQGMIAFFQEAHKRYRNNLPLNVSELMALPGVGDYVAAAIVCFANEQTLPLIDTNVVRVLGRLFGLSTERAARRRKDMRHLAALAVDPAEPAKYHYALLDFGATVCTARHPRCGICPFHERGRCLYYQQMTMADVKGDAGGADVTIQPESEFVTL